MRALDASQPECYPVRSVTAICILVCGKRFSGGLPAHQCAAPTVGLGHHSLEHQFGCTPAPLSTRSLDSPPYVLRILAGCRVHGGRSDLRRGL